MCYIEILIGQNFDRLISSTYMTSFRTPTRFFIFEQKFLFTNIAEIFWRYWSPLYHIMEHIRLLKNKERKSHTEKQVF
jgi:hypothetical protein